MPDYSLINTSSEFQKYVDALLKDRQRIIALDTEANNHRYAYGQQLCLIQIYDGTRTVIVDPVNIKSGTLRNLFENRDILKIMYDSPNDISLLVNSKNITIKSILDLRPGVELLDYAKKDLHSVICAELGVELTQKKKFQQYNWLLRPLAEEALEYAANDVKYLIRLKDIIINRLCEQQLLDLFILRNIRVQNRDYFNDPRDSYRRVKGYKGLDGEGKPLDRTAFKREPLKSLPDHVGRITDSWGLSLEGVLLHLAPEIQEQAHIMRKRLQGELGKLCQEIPGGPWQVRCGQALFPKDGDAAVDLVKYALARLENSLAVGKSSQ